MSAVGAISQQYKFGDTFGENAASVPCLSFVDAVRTMKFGQIMKDEQKSCLVGAKIEMFDFFVDYKRLKKLLRHLGSDELSQSEMRKHEQVFVENLEQNIARVEQFFEQKESQYYDSYKQSLRPLVLAHKATGSSCQEDGAGEGSAKDLMPAAGDGDGKGGLGCHLMGMPLFAVPGQEVGQESEGKRQKEGKEADGGETESIVEALEVSRDKVMELERYASLNLMAVVKICKKHDKLVRNNEQEHGAMLISPRVVASLSGMKFVSHARLNEVSQGLQAMWVQVTGQLNTDLCPRSTHSPAKQGLQRLHLAAQGGFAGWRGEGVKALSDLDPAGGRAGAEVVSIGDKGDIIVNGSINLEDLEDFEMSSDDDGDVNGDADAEACCVLGREESELAGTGGVDLGKADSSRRLGGAAGTTAEGAKALQGELTAANVAKLLTDLGAHPEHEGTPKKRARVMEWKEGADRAAMSPEPHGEGPEAPTELTEKGGSR